MASHPQTLLFLLLFPCLVTLSACTEGRTTNLVYNDFEGSNLRLEGIANIHPNGLLQLTNSSVFRTGHAFYPIPLSLSASPTLSTTFAFAIHPHPNHGGHGMAFVASSSMDFSRAGDTTFLGLFNDSTNGVSSNHVFAVELDTVYNAQVADIDGNHVGIDVNSLTSVDAAPAQYYSDQEGKNVSLNLMSGKPMQVWIEYNAIKPVVEVAIAPLGVTKPKKLLLSTRVNLSKVLLDTVYIGFSASTGSLNSDHYVLGWSFSTNGTLRNLDLSKLPSLPKERRKVSRSLIALISVVSIFLIVFVGCAYYAFRRKKYEELMEEWEVEYAPQRFSYKDLYNATKGFKENDLLGVGGFGKVYRGFLSCTNSQVAIKRVSHDSKQGMKEFVAEIASMRRLRHRNLVPLLGYSRRKGELLLVYEYMPNGSLDKLLFKHEQPKLPWSQRLKIIKGVASALHYLHEEWEQVVLHRDIKAANVLLDGDMNARLGDFGLARLHDHGGIARTTHVVGTLGYIAPELPRTGKASTSTDVYAFGVFLLEVACGRRPLLEEGTLRGWVLRCSSNGAILEASDPRLEGRYDTQEMELVLQLGLLCSQARPNARPAMRQVVQFLEGEGVLPQLLPIDGIEIDTLVPSTGMTSSFPNLLSSNEASASYSYSCSVDSTIMDVPSLN